MSDPIFESKKPLDLNDVRKVMANGQSGFSREVVPLTQPVGVRVKPGLRLSGWEDTHVEIDGQQKPVRSTYFKLATQRAQDSIEWFFPHYMIPEGTDWADHPALPLGIYSNDLGIIHTVDVEDRELTVDEFHANAELSEKYATLYGLIPQYQSAMQAVGTQVRLGRIGMNQQKEPICAEVAGQADCEGAPCLFGKVKLRMQPPVDSGAAELLSAGYLLFDIELGFIREFLFLTNISFSDGGIKHSMSLARSGRLKPSG
ncbi:MAG: hypothetical protein RIC36_04325 [Rhodospirillales bacterium]